MKRADRRARTERVIKRRATVAARFIPDFCIESGKHRDALRGFGYCNNKHCSCCMAGHQYWEDEKEAKRKEGERIMREQLESDQ